MRKIYLHSNGSVINISPTTKYNYRKRESMEERSKQLPAPPPISLLPPSPPFTLSSLLHTLFITADFPLARAVVSNPPTHQPPPHHSHEGAGVCPVISTRAFYSVGICTDWAPLRGRNQPNSFTTTFRCALPNNGVGLYNHNRGWPFR